MKNKICGIGIDTSPLMYKPSAEYAPEFVYIDTSVNNAFYLPEFCVGRKLIVRVGDLKKEVLEGLKKDLGTAYTGIDTLLIPASLHSSLDPDMLREILNEFEVGSVGIDRPEDSYQAKKAAESIKRVIIPSYLAINLSPLHFERGLIEWVEKEELDIISFNPFGGFLTAPYSIQMFTVPFLLSFSAAYSKLVFLSGRDLVNAQYETLYLEELVGGEIEDKLVKMTVGTDELIKTPNKLIRTGLKGSAEYDNPTYLVSPSELVLEYKNPLNPYQKIDEDVEEIKKPEVRKILEKVAEFDVLTLPHPNNLETYMSILRPTLLKELGEALGPDYEIEQAKIGSLTFLVNVRKKKREKRYLWKDRVWYEDFPFVMWINQDGELQFKHYENSALKP